MQHATTAGPVVTLDGVFGDWAGRVWPDIYVAALSSVPGEAFVVSAGPPGARRRGAVWHRVDLAAGAVLERHDLGVQTAAPIAVRADGERVVLIGTHHDSSLRVRTNTGRHMWRRRGGWRHAEYIPGEDRLLTWTPQGEIVELNASTGADIARFRGFPPIAVSTVTAGRAGRLIGFRAGRDHLAIWDRTQARGVASWPGQAHGLLPIEETGELLSLNHRGEPLYCFTPGQRRPSWQAPAPVEERWEPALARAGRWSETDALPVGQTVKGAFANDRRSAVLWNRAVFGVWDAGTGTARWPRSGHDNTVERLVVSPDGSLLATAGGWTVRLWDTQTGAERHTLQLGLGSLPNLAFSADGRLLLGTGYNDRQCWDVTTGEAVPFPVPLPGNPAVATAALARWRGSPDGRLLWLAESDGAWRVALSVISQPDGEVRWRGPGQAALAAFTADGTVVTVVDRPKDYLQPEIVRLDPAGGLVERRVRLHDLPSHTYHDRWALRDDGELVAVPGADLAVYDARTGQVRSRLDVVTNIAPAFIGDRWLAVLDLDRTVRVFDLDTGSSTTLPLDALDDQPYSLLGAGGHCYVGTVRGVAVRFAVGSTGAPSLPS